MNEQKERYYHVFYAHLRGFGAINATYPTELKQHEDILDVSATIQRITNLENVVVLHWIEIEGTEATEQKEHSYYVSFSHSRGFSSMSLLLPHQIKTFNDLKGITNHIETQNSLEGVAIHSWSEIVK